MSFLFHQALAMCYIALTASSALYIWASRNDGPGTLFARYASVIIYLLTIISVFHLLFNGSRHWDGYTFSEPLEITLKDTTVQR